MEKIGHRKRSQKKIETKIKQQNINNNKDEIESYLIPSKLLEIFQKQNKFEVFVDLITLLHQANSCSNTIFPLLIDQYSILPEENVIEASPLLLDALQRFPHNISFETFYNALLENGKENEVWHFVSAFPLSPLMLKHYKQCRLSVDQIESLVKSSSSDLDVCSILLEHYELSPLFYEKYGEKSEPFIINVVDKMDTEQLKTIYDAVKGSKSVLEQILAEKIGKEYNTQSDEPFYLLDRAVNRHDWEQAAKIAQKNGMDDEYAKYMALAIGATGVQAKLLKKNLTASEHKEIIDDFVETLSKAEEDQTFSEFSSDALMIAERIDRDIERIRKAKKDDNDLIDKLLKDDETSKENEVSVSISDKCCICNRLLGHSEVAVFPCGHCFHTDCLNDYTNELLSKSSLALHISDEPSKDCPFCGIDSAAYVHVPINNAMMSPEFWTLNL